MPYIGYIEVDTIFPENVIGRPKAVTTLALIVPDHGAIFVLIGTNALDILYEGFDECANAPVLESCSYAVLVKHLCSLYKSKTTYSVRVDVVYLLHRKAIIIPLSQKMVLGGYTRRVNSFSETPLLVDFPPRPLLCVLTFCCLSRCLFFLKKKTTHDVTVPSHSTLSVSPLTSLKGGGQTKIRESPESVSIPTRYHPNLSVASENSIIFDFGDSPHSKELKERSKEKLFFIPEVFAKNDLNYRHTTAVKHKIHLSDLTPFKQRVRPIYPSDYEAVRLHLKELYDFISLNIIKRV